MSTAVTDIDMYEVLTPRLGSFAAKSVVGFINTRIAQFRGRRVEDGVSATNLLAALQESLGTADARLVVSAIEQYLDVRFAQKRAQQRVN